MTLKFLVPVKPHCLNEHFYVCYVYIFQNVFISGGLREELWGKKN